MTALYVAGVAAGFMLNRRWSFRHSARRGPAFARYLLAYAVGYVSNWTGLFVLVDRAGWPHEAVQLGLVFGIAALLFFLQKFWVFRSVP